MKKGFVFFALLCTIHFGHASDTCSGDKVQIAVRSLQKAITQKDFSCIESMLDEEFAYGDLSCGSGCQSLDQILEYIINTYPESIQISKIDIDSIEKVGFDYRVMTTFFYEDKEILSESQEIMITDEGKILSLEIPKLKLQFGAPEESCGSDCGTE